MTRLSGASLVCWTLSALVALACSRPASKEGSPAPKDKPAAAAEAQTKPTATAGEPVAQETSGAPNDGVTCAPPRNIIASAVGALTTGLGLMSVDPQYVEVGDLNGDGRPEHAGFYRDQAFSFSWILTEVREGCFRHVMNASSGVVTQALTGSTRGWRDVELEARLNGMAGPGTVCQVTFVLLFR